MRTHPDIDLMTAKQQACSRLPAMCTLVAVKKYLMHTVFQTNLIEPES